MPELPEVERAAKLLRDLAKGRLIEEVETSEDTIVYTGGISHLDFANETKGRKILDVKRYGKLFYIMLDGDGRMPVLHFGMTGMIQVQGQEPTWYERKPKDSPDEWPPRFMKFILHIAAGDGIPAAKIAFRDARRLGRIRLCASPTEEPPISNLGFDPLLSMPDLESFSLLVKKRNVPVKALLLDQEFSAGVGNWVADEILFQSGIHPEQRANALEDDEIAMMHHKMVYICQTAVDVNADASQFPQSWLFPHRWGKGKKGKAAAFVLPDGQNAKIKWITVGGRTSAIVEQVQKPTGSASSSKSKKRKTVAKQEDNLSELSEPPSDTQDEAQATEEEQPPKRTRRAVTRVKSLKESDDEEVPSPRKKRKASTATKVGKKS